MGPSRTSHYTLGFKILMVLTNHQPILGLLSKSDIGEIKNPRL